MLLDTFLAEVTLPPSSQDRLTSPIRSALDTSLSPLETHIPHPESLGHLAEGELEAPLGLIPDLVANLSDSRGGHIQWKVSKATNREESIASPAQCPTWISKICSPLSVIKEK